MAQSTAADAGGESICTQCGLCCDGSLFRAARLKDDDDRELMATHGIRVREVDRQFELPCPCLVDKRCGIYDERFSTCRRFRCRLLKEVQDEGLAPSEALQVIAHATLLSRAIRETLAEHGIAPTVSLAVGMAQWNDAHPDHGADRLTVLYGALRAVVASRFSKRKPADAAGV
jgi:hypothetical protein